MYSYRNSYRGMGIQTFRGIIEIIVESALIYSVTLLIFVILITCNNIGGLYVDIIASYVWGIAPTLIAVVNKIEKSKLIPKCLTQDLYLDPGLKNLGLADTHIRSRVPSLALGLVRPVPDSQDQNI
ncbi:hypothetical protein ARMGADRAFT_1039523 [Armillaria gallica]|uniref:Uncharacterized protein n=1 Tax=Armillaria gallica TaxID=47427 RepID=A0A2H3CIG0_ARMGA|nr:hypothetical protein ARMGADRAFT_1039523 [Armillaria gallica]